MWTPPETYDVGEVLTAAKLNEQLRDNTDALHDTWRHMLYTRTTPSSSGASATLAVASWETMVADDWSGLDSGQNFFIPAAGRYSLSASLFFSGGTGSGWGECRIHRYNSGGTLQEVIGMGYCGLNSGLTASGLAVASAGDFFAFFVMHDASGTPQTWTGRAWVKQETVL